MPLNIKDEQTHQAARELADAMGTSITEAVSRAIQEALNRVHADSRSQTERTQTELDRIAVHCASLPLLDERTADEILGYDNDGIPG